MKLALRQVTLCAFGALLLAGARQASPSKIVLSRYVERLVSLDSPKALVFTYTLTQAGPQDIDQTHRIYRNGDLVRDETLIVGGESLHPKITRIARYRNRYAIGNVAPRPAEYKLAFVGVHKSGKRLQYVYRATALGAPRGFVVDGVTIDAHSYLPSEILFNARGPKISGKGSMRYAQVGRYWMPISIAVQARIGNVPARERIVFSGYRFPGSLPSSTFQLPHPLPTPTAPAL